MGLGSSISKAAGKVTGAAKKVTGIAAGVAGAAKGVTGIATGVVGSLLGNGAVNKAPASTMANQPTAQSGNQAAQNYEQAALAACKIAGLPENKVPNILQTAATIAPKNTAGKSILTIKSIATAALMISENRPKMNLFT